MMTSSNGNIFRVTCPFCGKFTGHWWIPLTNNREAGDLRRHRANYDVTVMVEGNCSSGLAVAIDGGGGGGGGGGFDK